MCCSIHQPLYPPGRIIHIVRHHPKVIIMIIILIFLFLIIKGRGGGRSSEPAYQGVWADNKDFDEVLISKRMLQDHMPDNVLDALEKVRTIVCHHPTFVSKQIWCRDLFMCVDCCAGEVQIH